MTDRKSPSFAIIQEDDGVRQKLTFKFVEQSSSFDDTPTIRNLLPFERYRHPSQSDADQPWYEWSEVQANHPQQRHHLRIPWGGGGEVVEEEGEEERLLGPMQSSSRAAKTIVRRRQKPCPQNELSHRPRCPPWDLSRLSVIRVSIYTRGR